MLQESYIKLSRLLLCSLAITILVGSFAEAQVAKRTADTLSSLEFRSERLEASQPVEPLEDVLSRVALPTQTAWADFRAAAPVEWRAVVDGRTGFITLAEGGNIAWIPGRGNRLSLENLALVLKPGSKKVDLATLERIARNYLPKVAGMLGVDPKSLVLNLGRSGQPAGHVWFVDFDVMANGRVVEGARVVFRVNNGNLIQFGTENLPALGAVVPPAKLTRDQALAAVAKYIGGVSSTDSFSDNGSTHLLTVNVPSTRSADGFDFGAGRGLAQVWQFAFHRDGVMGNWQARVDAATGEVLELVDVNDYATAAVSGGTYLNSPTTGSEVVRPAPYADLSIGGNANAAGLYNFTSGTVTSTLNGPFVRILDTCGAISQASDASGNIAFGTSAGTDCTTPGHGGAGNTHASREQFYQVNRIKDVAKGWLPANAWLGSKLSVNVNLNLTCNAYWRPADGTLNFFKSGGGCGNTGAIAGVSLHEFGHGIDQNDGTGTAPEGGTGESYGDTTAIIALHNSCIGPGFRGSNCDGYGDACTSCTGVRDADFAKHTSNTPATVANFTQVRCRAGAGPCGREVHCESYPITETLWDFANRDLPNPGTGPAWTTLDRLWYLSRNTATSAFACTTGGTFTSNGCNTGSLWKTLRAVDDDDGNLSNGTPHGGALFAAFNRHAIACTTDAGASTTFSGCTPPPTPTLTATAGSNSAGLSWTASGTAVYDVFRNETGCNAGFTKIVSGGAATTLTDNNVSNGLTYFYQVTAFPSGNEACASAPSTCVTVSPTQITVTVSPPTAALTAGTTQPFTATVTGNPVTSVTWSITPQVGSISPSGLYTAPATIPSVQTVSVSACSTVDASRCGQAIVSLIPLPQLSPAGLVFALQGVGTPSSPQTAVLTNNNSSALAISAITVAGDFTESDDCHNSLAAGASCSINVIFSPTAAGVRMGTLTVSHAAANSPQTVDLSGIAPSSLTFSSQVVGTISAAQPITITNGSTSPLSITGLSVNGGDFRVSNGCTAPLAVNASCTSTVTFAPILTGTRTGSLSLSFNRATSPLSVSLSGTGLPLVPVLTGIVPSTVTVGSSGFTLVAIGSSFLRNAVVRVNGSDRPTTYVNSPPLNLPLQLRATISAADLASTGLLSITVFNPGASGGESGALPLTVTTTPIPLISSLSPVRVVAGGPPLTLTVNGSNFPADSVVQVNTTIHPTTWVSATQLTLTLSDAEIAASRLLSITVGSASTPTSNAAPLLVFRYGDLNSDNKINVSDLSALANFLAGNLNLFDTTVAELNCDGVVNVADLSTLANYLAGNLQTLPACPQ